MLKVITAIGSAGAAGAVGACASPVNESAPPSISRAAIVIVLRRLDIMDRRIAHMPHLTRRQFSATVAAACGMAGLKLQAIQTAARQTGLRDVFKDDFLMGTALGGGGLAQGTSPLLELVAREYNAITPTNMMKWGPIEPREGEWQWDMPDRFVAWGEAHDMRIVGHNLVWHSQVPGWLFVDADKQPVTKDALIARLETHIRTLVGRYKG